MADPFSTTTTTVIPPLHPCFAQLPPELSLKILTHTLHNPRIIEISSRPSHLPTSGPDFHAPSHNARLGPVCLRINSVTRALTLKSYTRLPFCWINFDTIYLGQSMTWDSSLSFYHSLTTKLLRDNLRFFAANFNTHFASYPSRYLLAFNKQLHFAKLEEFTFVMHDPVMIHADFRLRRGCPNVALSLLDTSSCRNEQGPVEQALMRLITLKGDLEREDPGATPSLSSPAVAGSLPPTPQIKFAFLEREWEEPWAKSEVEKTETAPGGGKEKGAGIDDKGLESLMLLVEQIMAQRVA